jgi:hypothetical protein
MGCEYKVLSENKKQRNYVNLGEQLMMNLKCSKGIGMGMNCLWKASNGEFIMTI